MYNFVSRLYITIWVRLICLVTSPFFLILFILILRVFCFGIVECHGYNGTIYVINAIRDYNIFTDTIYYESWLVHRDIISTHLGLDNAVIAFAAGNDSPELTLDWGFVHIDQCVIDFNTWDRLVNAHSEMTSAGVSCALDYHSLRGMGYIEPSDIINWFLETHCV